MADAGAVGRLCEASGELAASVAAAEHSLMAELVDVEEQLGDEAPDPAGASVGLSEASGEMFASVAAAEHGSWSELVNVEEQLGDEAPNPTSSVAQHVPDTAPENSDGEEDGPWLRVSVVLAVTGEQLLSVKLRPSDDVMCLRMAVAGAPSGGTALVHLLFESRILQVGGVTLADAGLHDGAVVQLVRRPPQDPSSNHPLCLVIPEGATPLEMMLRDAMPDTYED